VTLSDNRARATRRLAVGLRWGGAVVAAAGLVALGLVNASSPAQADGTPPAFDQMNGTGSTASAVTVPWTSGLLNSSNKPITVPGSDLDPNVDRQNDTGPYAFMDDGYTNAAIGDTNYGAFKNLAVTVSQTQDIGHAGVTVSWTGGTQTVRAGGGVQSNYLQMMECYGNAPTGPSPEGCEFGQGVLPAGTPPNVGARTGDLCASPTLSTTNPTGGVANGPGDGCDPFEPTTETPTHFPCTVTNGVQTGPDCLANQYNVPFVPEGGGTPLYNPLTGLPQAFDQFSTNEVDVATTRADGTGQQQFETVTSVQSSGLGCGQQQSDGTPQGCWLVIVPRGVYEPNGYNTVAPGNAIGLVSSPLSAGNWAQRIQVHLDYAPLPNSCPLNGNGRESLMEGSQLITRAVQSWELKLNQDSNCGLIYHLVNTSEQQVTNDFTIPVTPGTPANGLAFTTVPVGDDRLRNGQSLPPLPNIVYAPVAIMALDFGFHIDEVLPNDTTHQNGDLTTPVKLTPQLLARALSQSYKLDVPTYDPLSNAGAGVQHPGPFPGPAWAQSNPTDISNDSLFQKLNPEVIPFSFAQIPIAPLDTVDHSAYYQQAWQWIQADPTASGWLDGAKDPGITVDPFYESQQLGKPPGIDSMPRSFPTCLDLGSTPSGEEAKRCSTDELPYVFDFDSASAAVLSGNPLTFSGQWDPNATAPDGSSGYWGKNPAEPPGSTFEWAVDATPYTAAYGIVPAQLCSDSGSNCIGPTVASVTAAVNNAKPDSDGLLEVNPAKTGAGAYPLTEIMYAAVRTDMPAQALTDYASFISFAADQGQAPGQAGGDLPAGYLPLPASLKAQANAVVAQLRQIAAGGPPPTKTPTGNSSSSSSSPAGGPSTGAGPNGGGGTNPGGTNPGGTQPSTAPNSPASSVTPNSVAGTSPASSSCPTPTAASTPTASTVTSTAAPTATASTCAPGPVIAPPTIQLAAGNTPGQPVGPIRQVLVVVVIVGIAGAGGGILLRRGRLPRWPGRSRP
jgi:hypothetical protein